MHRSAVIPDSGFCRDDRAGNEHDQGIEGAVSHLRDRKTEGDANAAQRHASSPLDRELVRIQQANTMPSSS